MPGESRAARAKHSVEQSERLAQRRTRRPCDKASQRRRSRTRRCRVVNKSCEQHRRTTRCWCAQRGTSASMDRQTRAVLTDHQQGPKLQWRHRERERPQTREALDEALGRLITWRLREAQTRRSGKPGRSHCGARSQQLAPVVRTHGLWR